MRRLPWAWPLAALIIGVAFGLAYAWIVAPDRGSGNPPRSLRSNYQDQWREAIAAAYAATGDLERARIRLELLGSQNIVETLSAQAQRVLASGEPFETAQELARLASDLQAGVSSIPSATGLPMDTANHDMRTPKAAASTPETESQNGTSTPLGGTSATVLSSVTPSPIPTATPYPSPSAPFRLVSQQEVCEPEGKPGLLQITLFDGRGNPFPGIEVTITWDQGADRFFTGLQPEISPGYADYTMVGGKSYSLQIARMGAPLSRIEAPLCTSPDGQTYLGGLQLIMSAP